MNKLEDICEGCEHFSHRGPDCSVCELADTFIQGAFDVCPRRPMLGFDWWCPGCEQWIAPDLRDVSGCYDPGRACNMDDNCLWCRSWPGFCPDCDDIRLLPSPGLVLCVCDRGMPKVYIKNGILEIRCDCLNSVEASTGPDAVKAWNNLIAEKKAIANEAANQRHKKAKAKESNMDGNADEKACCVGCNHLDPEDDCRCIKNGCNPDDVDVDDCPRSPNRWCPNCEKIKTRGRVFCYGCEDDQDSGRKSPISKHVCECADCNTALIRSPIQDNETNLKKEETTLMEKITTALSTTNQSTIENVKTGVKQGAAVKAEKVIMEQMQRLVGDSFPTAFYATPLGEFVMDVGACYLVTISAEVLPQVPAADAVKEYAGHAVVGVTAKATEPLFELAEQLITGIATKAALTEGS